jgi:hypothetical protein
MATTIDQNVFDMLDILRSPIITFDASWADCLPKRLLDLVTLSRTAKMMLHEEEASDPEAAFDAPMSRDWSEIYIHISCKVCEQYWQEDHWNSVQAKRELTEYEDKYLLKPLRKFIYDRRRKALKEKMKEEKKTEIGFSPIRTEKIEQLKLF